MTETLRFRRADSGGRPSPPDLLRECGERLTDPLLWKEFQAQFHQLILRSVTRIMWNRYRNDCLEEACDIAQDVYLRLLSNNGRLLRSFKGQTDLSARSFLSRVAVSVVSDHFRSQQADKRRPAEIISIEEARQQGKTLPGEAADLDIASILSWIDVERLMEAEPDRRHAARNVLICKLHYVDELTVSEIAEFPVFGLNRSAIGTVIQNMRSHLKKRMGK
jgi:RNA polymerase sigma factor (sigma-70 family)